MSTTTVTTVQGANISKIRAIGSVKVNKNKENYYTCVYNGRGFNLPEDVYKDAKAGKFHSLDLVETTFMKKTQNQETGLEELVETNAYQYDGHITKEANKAEVIYESELEFIKTPDFAA